MADGKRKYTRNETYVDPDGGVVTVAATVSLPAEWPETAQRDAQVAVDRGVESLHAIVNHLHLERQPDLFHAATEFQRGVDELRERGITTSVTTKGERGEL